MNGPWTEEYLEELAAFGPDCAHDDQVDGSANAFNTLCAGGARWEELYPPDAAADESDGLGVLYAHEEDEGDVWARV